MANGPFHSFKSPPQKLVAGKGNIQYILLKSLESVRFFFKVIVLLTFIQQGHIKLIKSDSKDIYIVSQVFHFK